MVDFDGSRPAEPSQRQCLQCPSVFGIHSPLSCVKGVKSFSLHIQVQGNEISSPSLHLQFSLASTRWRQYTTFELALDRGHYITSDPTPPPHPSALYSHPSDPPSGRSRPPRDLRGVFICQGETATMSVSCFRCTSHLHLTLVTASTQHHRLHAPSVLCTGFLIGPQAFPAYSESSEINDFLI